MQVLAMISDCCAGVEICNHPPSSNRINMIPLEPRGTGALCCIALQHLGLYVWRISRGPTRTRTAPEKLPWTAGSLLRNGMTWFISCSSVLKNTSCTHLEIPSVNVGSSPKLIMNITLTCSVYLLIKKYIPQISKTCSKAGFLNLLKGHCHE